MPSFDAIRPSQTIPDNRVRGGLFSREHYHHHPDNFITAEEEARRQRVLGRIPTLSGRHEIASFRDQTNKQFIKVEQDERVVQNLKQFIPAADTLSNFPSAGAEAESGGFKPYSALVNKEEDLRPGSVEPNKSIPSPIPGIQMKEEPWERSGELSQYYKPDGEEDQDDVAANTNKISEELLTNRELRDKIATRAFYTSSTKKLYEGVDWANIIPRRQEPPSTVKEQRPDMVAQRIRRYEDKPEDWQKHSGKLLTWDYLQSRNGYYKKRPFSFSSQSQKVGQIPNYTGHIAGEGEMDVHGEPFSALTRLRNSKPKFTTTSRKGFIPGYTGCVLWTNSNPPLSAEKNPRPESTARTYRPLKYHPNKSAYKHEGPLSKMVTLTHPFNPFDNKQPPASSTASGNRA